MSRSKLPSRRPFETKFWVITGIVAVLSVAELVALWPGVVHLAHQRADQLVAAGQGSSGSEAQLDFKVAQLLDPHNQRAATVVASQFLNQGQPAQALATLDRATNRKAGESADLSALYIQARLELNDTTGATAAASQLVNQGPSQDQLQLAVLAYAVGEQGSRINALVGRLDASEASQRVLVVVTDKLALAQELYARGLLNSSQRLLTTLPNSLPRDLLLGRLWSRQPSKEALGEARDFYAAAASLEPTNREAHQELSRILQTLGDHDGATHQTELLHRLEAGQV